MSRMMVRAGILVTVATVALLTSVMGTEAGPARPPSASQDLGLLSAANDYNVLLNLTLKNGSPVVHTVDVDDNDIPADRQRLLVAVKTYWNKFPNFAVIDPSGIRHEIGGLIKDPNQSNTFWINVPAEDGQYEIELSSNGGTYTYFVEAVLVAQEGWPF